MHLVMGVPLRVATATSNLMMGITASAGAIVYLSRGLIDPFVTAPTALGVFVGASIGSRVAHRIDVRILRACSSGSCFTLPSRCCCEPSRDRGPAPQSPGPTSTGRSGRLLTIGTNAAVLLLAIGCVLMFAYRHRPAGRRPAAEPGLIIDDITHLQPPGSSGWGCWSCSRRPVMRVVVSLRGFIIRGERTMSIVAALILVVIALSIVLGRAES